MRVPTGATQLTAVIGSPVRHSLSPTLHNAAFAAADRDWVMLAFEVARGSGAAAVDAMRTLGLRGLAVTMPHKSDVAAAVDEVDPAAAVLGSVNTVVLRDDGTTFGASTDGEGFVASLLAHGIDPAGARIALLGAGAAARALVDALGRAGVADLAIVNRSVDNARRAAELAVQARIADTGDIRNADIVVNATPVGMGNDRAAVRPGTARSPAGRRRSRLPPAGDGAAAGGARCRRTRDQRAGDARPPGRPAARTVDGRTPRPRGDAVGNAGRARQAPRVISPGCSVSSPPASRTGRPWWW